MTGVFLLDWAILAVSLFNTVVLLWLGLTVLLNAERRVWGIWVAAGGLLLGSVFFISHTALIGHGVTPITPGLNFWWKTGWIPIAALPLAWYVVMLWYSGFWQRRKLSQSRITERHRPWFTLVLTAGIIGIALLLFFNPLPSLAEISTEQLVSAPAEGGILLLIVAYPVYTLLCMGLSLDALRRPAPSGRLMGDLARHRARGWLMAVSVILLAVGLMVGWVLIWFLRSPHEGLFSPGTVEVIGWFDLVIESLIAVAVVLLGQAVVTYEIFTGKSLPRRGLSQYWQRALILAAGFSLVLAWSISIQLRPIYSILLSMLLMVVFFALLGWRAFAERERAIQSLRPFVSHQRLYADILEGKDGALFPHLSDIRGPFHALCTDILEVRQACLVPFGALAPLSGAPLVFPEGLSFNLPAGDLLAAEIEAPDTLGIPLVAERYGGMVFAISLWNEGGLIGALLLGEKTGGGLYTQEEIEIARAIGEHLLDTKASIELSRRLVSLQRQRLVQSQVLDQQARRILHDEILPSVHTVMLDLSATPPARSTELIAQLEQIHRQLSHLLRSMPATTAVEVRRLGFIGALRKTVEVDLDGSFDAVTWEIQPEGERVLDDFPLLIAEVLFSAVRESMRNAARHGRQKDSAEPFCLSVGMKAQNGLVITVEDNGAGFSTAPAAETTGRRSTPAEDGGGQGLALHSTMIAVIGGQLSVESAPGLSTRVTITLPESAWKNWE